MISTKLFTKEEEKENQAKKGLLPLLDFNKEDNKIFEIDTVLDSRKHILKPEDVVQISSIISKEENKNVFLVNSIKDNTDIFLKIFNGLVDIHPKFLDKKNKEIKILFLNVLSLNSKISRNDISLMRSLNKINIFLPVDANHAEYLVRIMEGKINKNISNGFSYFRFLNADSPKIFEDDYFINQNGDLREYTAMPEIVHVSKTLDSAFKVGIIVSGPLLYNALIAARELEEKKYSVNILNVSLISSNSEYINQKIKSNILNFSRNNKNILTVEDHFKDGGLGSLVAETVSENKNDHMIRVERLGIDEDISPRNIISKCEEICGW